MISTPSTSPLRRRIVVVSAATLAVGVLSAVAPAPAIEAASAATTTTSTTTTVTTAGQVAASGTVSAIAATPTARTAPVVTRVTTARVALVAPYRFATVNYNKWWAKRILVTKYHVTSTAQFTCLVTVWTRESHWNYKAHNYSSGAHGIPQALPGSKMRTAGADWRTNPVTQIKWGLGYIHNRYGTPCAALRHMNNHGWY